MKEKKGQSVNKYYKNIYYKNITETKTKEVYHKRGTGIGDGGGEPSA